MAKPHSRIKKSSKDDIVLPQSALAHIQTYGVSTTDVIASRLQAVGQRDGGAPEIISLANGHFPAIAAVFNEQTGYVLNGPNPQAALPPENFGELRERFANAFDSLPGALSQAIPQMDARVHPSLQQVYLRMSGLLEEHIGKNLPKKAR